MRIEAGVRFLFAKVPVCRRFPIHFNDHMLCCDSNAAAIEPVDIYTNKHLNEWSGGVHILMILL